MTSMIITETCNILFGMRSIRVIHIASYFVGRGRNAKRWRRLWRASKIRGRIRNEKLKDHKGCLTILLKVLVVTENFVLLYNYNDIVIIL